MAAFKATDIYGTVSFLGAVLFGEASIASTQLSQVQLKFDGLIGDKHGGASRASCARVSMLYPKATPIRNFRQISILSDEELAMIASEIGIKKLDPTWLGANIVLDGINDFTHIPPSSRLIFENGASIAVDVTNPPCIHTAKNIADETNIAASQILPALKERRGVVGSVEAEGLIKIGEKARLFVPNARAYHI